MTESFSIYFAGDLFDHKHLIGNVLLAQHIESVSAGSYQCVLPQNLEQGRNRKQDIRNQDLAKVIECDMGLFNFDGPDLDSGTVVEFMLAKMLDIPAVILRTDLRAAGDQDESGDNWNLMCSFYPRTEVVRMNGMVWYQEKSHYQPVDWNTISAIYTPMAEQLVAALDRTRAQQPLAEAELADRLYDWSLRFPGAGLTRYINDESWIAGIVARKRQKGLLK